LVNPSYRLGWEQHTIAHVKSNLQRNV